MQSISAAIYFSFVVTTLLTVYFFYKASHQSVASLWVILGWLALQGIISYKGIYLVTDVFPPRLMLVLVPPLVLILYMFGTKKGRSYMDGLDTSALTLLHVVRIPVELVLFGLFLHHAVPQLMTFEGNNLDIISGITAPIIYYLGYQKKKLNRWVLLCWNLGCLALLINIVVIAIFSAPFPFQRFAFDQPNIAVLHFPFVWLPACIVPLVLFSHLVCIRALIAKRN